MVFFLLGEDRPGVGSRAGPGSTPRIASSTRERLGVRFVSIENELDSFPLNKHDLFMLVRPDRYIYGVFREEQATAFALTFQKHLMYLIHTQK